MADIKSSWILPSFYGKVVAIPEDHANPLIRNSEERKYDNEHFFSEDTPRAEGEHLLSKYNVSYILLNSEFVRDELIRDIAVLGTVITKKNGLILMKRL